MSVSVWWTFSAVHSKLNHFTHFRLRLSRASIAQLRDFYLHSKRRRKQTTICSFFCVFLFCLHTNACMYLEDTFACQWRNLPLNISIVRLLIKQQTSRGLGPLTLDSCFDLYASVVKQVRQKLKRFKKLHAHIYSKKCGFNLGFFAFHSISLQKYFNNNFMKFVSSLSQKKTY